MRRVPNVQRLVAEMALKRLFVKNRWVLILVTGVALIALVTFLQPQKRTFEAISARPTLDSLADLLKEADADLKEGKPVEAMAKYRQVLEIDPKTPGLQTKLRQAEKALLRNAQGRVAAGDPAGAVKIAENIIAGNPDNDGARQIIDEVGDDKTEAIGGWEPADLDDPNSTPAGILPPEMPGYKIIQNGWLNEPHVGGATYAPRSPTVAKEIDRVLLTVGKYETVEEANAQLSYERELFSVGPRENDVNGHPAQFAQYVEPRPDVFPILTSLNWTRNNWFFSVQIAPLIDRETGTQPSTEFAQGIAVDVAKKLGY